MKRKDFMKSCLALGLVPLLPKIRESREGEISPFYGSGFHQKNGIVQGYWSEDNGGVEVFILDYQRIPYDKKLLGSKPPRYGKPTDSVKKKKEYFAHDKLLSKLNQMLRKCIDENQIAETTEETRIAEKIWSKRLPRWMKRLRRHYPFKERK